MKNQLLTEKNHFLRSGSHLLAGTTGFEPAISALTGPHVNRYTTPPAKIILTYTPFQSRQLITENLISSLNDRPEIDDGRPVLYHRSSAVHEVHIRIPPPLRP